VISSRIKDGFFQVLITPVKTGVIKISLSRILGTSEKFGSQFGIQHFGNTNLS